MIRKLVIGSGMLALVPSVKAASPIPSEPQKPPPMRLEDLPVYEAPHANYNEHITEKNKSDKFSYIQSALEGPVRTVREQVQNVFQQTSTVTNAFSDNYHEIIDRTDWIVKYLREEENRDQRYGAVAIGGLTGFIFGLRGGFIKRLFYAVVGTSAMGAVCFPEETKRVYENNGALLRTYVNIAYNFLYGVKPGDPQLEVKFPELSLPKDFSEFVDLTTSLASSVKQAVMPPPAKDSGDNKTSDKKE